MRRSFRKKTSVFKWKSILRSLQNQSYFYNLNLTSNGEILYHTINSCQKLSKGHQLFCQFQQLKDSCIVFWKFQRLRIEKFHYSNGDVLSCASLPAFLHYFFLLFLIILLLFVFFFPFFLLFSFLFFFPFFFFSFFSSFFSFQIHQSFRTWRRGFRVALLLRYRESAPLL